MIQEDKDIELIELYLEEKLSSGEKQEFQERLEKDPEFRNSFESYKLLFAGIEYSGGNLLRQRLKKLEASITVQESFNKRRFGIPLKSFYSYSAAATILLLLTFTFIFILRHDASPREVFIENFKPYPNVVMPTTRGEEEVKTEEQQAYYLYDLEKYREAASIFNKLLKQGEEPGHLLYSANSHIAIGDYGAAIDKLKRLIEKDSEYRNQAQWFLSLAYLAKNDPENAKPYLNNLSKQNNSYSKKAAKILKDLQLVGSN